MLLLLVYLSIALFFSFLCSMLEAIILSTTPTFIEIKIEEGKKYARRLKQMKENIDKPLAAILTLNTFAHTIGAAGVGAQAQMIWGNEYLSVISIVLTLLILFFSEIIPKTLGATYWKSLVPFTTHVLRILIFALYPFIIISQFLTSRINKRKGKNKITRRDFTALAKIGMNAGIFEREESRILLNIFKFNKFAAKDILTPRTVVKSLSEDITLEEFYSGENNLRFSRIPVYKNNPDDVSGYVLKDELLADLVKGNNEKRLVEFKRDIPVVFENYPVYRLFRDMIDNKGNIVLVIDEHGGMEGIVTMEDIVETLTGLEIVDETDIDQDMRELAKKVWKKKTT